MPSLPDFEDELLAQFLRELEAAADRDAVVAVYSERHPPLANEFRDLAAMNQIVARSAETDGDGIPDRLGDFRIVRRIGRGGMGDIYEAVQDRLNRRVAVKTIRRGRISPQARGRWTAERFAAGTATGFERAKY